MTAALYTVDREAVDRARLFLGLLLPVRVRRCRMAARGRYAWAKGDIHRISLHHFLGVEEASEVLWHELVHARQFEQRGCDWRAFYADYYDGLPPPPPVDDLAAFWDWHLTVSMEREAHAAKINHHWLPLTKPSG